MVLRLEQFQFYNKELETRRTRRDLPHWEQDRVCAFVTFRMADSLPQEVIAEWLAERDAWLRAHGIDPDNERWREALDDLPDEIVDAFHRTFTRRLHEFLDAGYGSCLLRRAELRRIVEDSLRHWHSERCLLAGWVMMPNHVHVLVQPMSGRGLLMETLDRPPHQRSRGTPRNILAGRRLGPSAEEAGLHGEVPQIHPAEPGEGAASIHGLHAVAAGD